MTHISLLEVKLKYLFSALTVRIHQNCTWKNIFPYEFLNMAEASSGLDLVLEASRKINSVIFISIYEVSENWKESEEVGSVADTTKT